MCKIIFILLLIANVSFAQDDLSFWQQVKNDFTLPLTASSDFLLTGVAITGGLVLTRDQTVDPLQAETSEEKPMGRYSKFGDMSGQMYPCIFYVAGMQTYSYFASDSTAHDYAALMVKSTLYSSIVTGILKTAIREPRPDNPNELTSFPSAHATRAFAFASTIYSLHGWAWGVPAYTIATAVAYSRMNDNRHYLHDVVAGAIIGMSYGLSLTEQYQNEKKLMVMPTNDGISVNLNWRF